MTHDHEHEHAHGQPSEEELRAQLEEELRRITVRDVLVQTVVTLVNLGGQRLGLGPGAEDMRDLEQARLAIEGVRALLPLLEQEDAEQLRPVRDALAQLQLAYARLAQGEEGGGEGGGPGGPPGGGAAGPEEPPPAQPGPERGPGAGGLWVPPGSTG